MNHLATIILAIFGSTGFWTLINTLIQARSKRKSAEQKMLLGLGHDKLYYLCKRYIAEGQISADDYDNLRYIYEPYHEMGGNGTGDKLFHEVEKLPLLAEEK